MGIISEPENAITEFGIPYINLSLSRVKRFRIKNN
jgi:hypothetical protein